MTSVINYNVKEVFSKLSCFFLGGGWAVGERNARIDPFKLSM